MAGWNVIEASRRMLRAPEGGAAGAAVLHHEIAPLISRIGAYDPKLDAALIDEAYSLAAEAHAAQRRE
ncbi:MAG TPA: hypothetical protein VFN77_07520, partial [Acetobacteraceae bacterium]|nr:hypothetical protein [Acetobacteraceae bacterium]